MNRKGRKVPAKIAEFLIYLCVTLRKPLRSLRLNKKAYFKCVTPKEIKKILDEGENYLRGCKDYSGTQRRVYRKKQQNIAVCRR